MDELQTALDAKEPFIVVGPMSDNYLVAYDMATTGCNLTNVSVSDIRDVFADTWTTTRLVSKIRRAISKNSHTIVRGR